MKQKDKNQAEKKENTTTKGNGESREQVGKKIKKQYSYDGEKKKRGEKVTK